MDRKLYNKILVATDGSENAKKAADAGIEIARLSSSKVHAAYVIDTSAYSSVPKDPRWEDVMYEQFRNFGLEATSYVENTGKRAGVEVESVLLEGNPAEEIVNFAERNKVELIVIGSLGKSRIERFLIGSVSERVIRNAKVSVLIVRDQSA